MRPLPSSSRFFTDRQSASGYQNLEVDEAANERRFEAQIELGFDVGEHLARGPSVEMGERIHDHGW